MNKEEKLKTVSFMLTFIWIILVIPMIPLFFIMGISTLMITDSGAANNIQIALISISCCFFWATPVLALVSLAISFYLRKKAKFIYSIIIQLTPIASVSFAFLLLALIFCLK